MSHTINADFEEKWSCLYALHEDMWIVAPFILYLRSNRGEWYVFTLRSPYSWIALNKKLVDPTAGLDAFGEEVTVLTAIVPCCKPWVRLAFGF